MPAPPEGPAGSGLVSRSLSVSCQFTMMNGNTLVSSIWRNTPTPTPSVFPGPNTLSAVITAPTLIASPALAPDSNPHSIDGARPKTMPSADAYLTLKPTFGRLSLPHGAPAGNAVS